MKVLICFIFLLTAGMNFAQNNYSIEFELYKNGEFKSLKNVKVKLVKNSDTIMCEIVKGKILFPKKGDEFSVIVTIKNEIYVVDKVDFSKLYSASKFIFGIEKNLKNFKPISTQYPNIYELSNTSNFIKIENLNKAKRVNFVVFTSKSNDIDKSTTGKSYTQYSLIE